jgi:DNA-binding response OmpR family regulator
MKSIEIMAVGTHPDIMKTISRLLNSKTGWNAMIAKSLEEALDKSQQTAFDIVLVCAGLNADETQQLQAHFKAPVIQHYGGGSGLIYAEVCEALKIALR